MTQQIQQIKNRIRQELIRTRRRCRVFFSFSQIERSRAGNIGRKIDLRWRRRDKDFQRCSKRLHRDLFYRWVGELGSLKRAKLQPLANLNFTIVKSPSSGSIGSWQDGNVLSAGIILYAIKRWGRSGYCFQHSLCCISVHLGTTKLKNGGMAGRVVALESGRLINLAIWAPLSNRWIQKHVWGTCTRWHSLLWHTERHSKH